MSLVRAATRFRDGGRDRRSPGQWFASALRAFCRVGAIASVAVLVPSALALAQDTDRKEPPAPAAQEAAPERSLPPAAAPEAAPDRKEAPAPAAQEAAPDRATTPAPAQDAAPERKSAPARGQAAAEPDRIRGRIAQVEAGSISVQTGDGRAVRVRLSKDVPVFTLTKASYADVAFGTYVGAVSVKLGDHIFSPIVRDSLSWLHKGFELRIIDEQLRGIALGHQKWDLTPDSVMTHGWVDDQEDRVISIKYGPTEEEETDVEVPRDVPVLRMSLGDRSLIKAGARIFAGATKDARGEYVGVFIFVGKDGIAPPL
jgi:hypothetical protein